MIYAYMRTARNNEDQITEQREAIVNWAERNRLKIRMHIAEHGSGLKINKGLKFILDNITADDLLVMTHVSRLSRNFEECLKILQDLEDKHIEVMTLEHGLEGFDMSALSDYMDKLHNR